MFLKILFLSSILACLDKSRNKTKCQIFYKNLIELSPGQRGVDLIIGLESQSRQPARVVSGLNKPIFNLTQYFIRSYSIP